jgi:hypothetical protein
MEKIREKHPKECEGKENWEIMKSSFIWIDDGKNDLKEVKLTNTKTGEIKKIKIKKK